MISVAAGNSFESVDNAVLSLANAKKGRIRIELPVSPGYMEYQCHKKPDKMLLWIEKIISYAKERCEDVEFCAVDATRAEKSFLQKVVFTAIKAGANEICISNNFGEFFPDDYAEFVREAIESIDVPVGIYCNNENGLALANTLLCIKNNISYVKTSVGNDIVNMFDFCSFIRNCSNKYEIDLNVNYTVLNKSVEVISTLIDESDNYNKSIKITDVTHENISLDSESDKNDLIKAIEKIGYDLSRDDIDKVYEEFSNVIKKKNIGVKELDAIIASTAAQVPETYKLVNYVINSGNTISTSAQISLSKNGVVLNEISIGNGPIATAFMTIDKIVGYKYELDDFVIQAVTEGKEAVGSTVVRLRYDGKIYSGKGVSTDIIESGIRAYLNAVNKIVYEEN